jgi:predicted ATPase/DNA-binding winged helix-turn-helix (wHTH) protein
LADRGQRAVYRFDVWEIDLARRELRSRGAVVPLGSRAFAILEILVQSSGQLVNKYDVMNHVWPNESPDENKLRFHISAVRQALGADRSLVKTISGRGYCLLGVWSDHEAGELADPLKLPQRHREQAFRTNVPAAGSALVGRDKAKRELLDIVSAHRVVTLTGPGGIGKSVLGLEVARSLLPMFDGDCWFVELASLSDPKLVPSKLISVIGLRIGGQEISAEAVARAIAREKLLLILDNCEHVVDAAATLVETIVHMCPRASIIATSRELLRVEGEYVYRVTPLEVPSPSSEDLSSFQRYSAVQLFIGRMTALESGFSARPEHLQAIAAICRRLDGIPLAIEFAAAHAITFGLEEVARGLQDRFSILTGGRRTALPRHQTLRATLDWSYELLPELERSVLRRLGIFVGGFTLAGATAVMRDTGVTASALVQALANLVAKSLVASEGAVSSGRWRLLETMRAYACDKLGEHGERRQVAKYHAEFFRDLVVSSVSVARRLPAEALARYTQEIDNVRAALDWSFSSTEDTEIGLALTAGYGPVWLDLSLPVECRERVAYALERLNSGSEQRDPRLQMQLQMTYGVALMVTLGPVERARGALSKGLELAVELGDLDAHVQALWALWAVHFNTGQHRAAQSVAERLVSVADRAGDVAIAAVARRSMGYTLHYMGMQREARENLERAIDLSRSCGSHSNLRFLYDQEVLARASLARSMWLQGLIDQADAIANACLADVSSGRDKLTFCFVLGMAVGPVALMRGDLTNADLAADMLLESAMRQSFTQYVNVGRALKAALMMERGEFAAASKELRAAFGTRESTGWRIGYPEYACALARCLAGLGRFEEALGMLEQGLALSEEGGERWYVPELLRVRGEVRLRYDASGPNAEDCFREAIGVARQQGALFWELRAAADLARLLLGQGRNEEACRALAAVYDKFTEGFEVADLRAARLILAAARSG